MNRRLHLYACFTAAATFFLIIAGGLVTSTGSGLAVPDWPLSYGQFFPPMRGGIFFEHGHRMVAATVGFLTVILAFWLWRKEPRKSVRALGWTALSAVVIQGVLGGITVLYLLPTPISVTHACLGQTFFCLVATIALTTSSAWKTMTRSDGESSALPVFALLVSGAVYLQLVFGALMRHMGAGLAIPDFPRSFGLWFPPAFSDGVLIHFTHRVWALAVLALAANLFVHVFRKHRGEKLLVRFSVLLGALLVIQVSLGAFTIWTSKAVVPATAHVACGAAVLATSLMITLISVRRFGFPRTDRLADSWTLGKPRITLLVCLTALAGFYLASPEPVDGALLAWTFFATAAVAFGASALNQVMERKVDALMRRTAGRPLPAGRLSVGHGWCVGIAASVAGLALFLWKVNPLSALLAAVTLLSYLLLYTPLKRRSHFCTIVGAVPGAIPPMIGWAAASGGLSYGAWILFGILFLWQLPHFLAIAWLYADDYAQARFPMLPVVDPTGESTGRQLYLYCSALLSLALLPTLAGMAGVTYFFGALVLGSGFLFLSISLMRHRTPAHARRLLLGSVLYLPLLMILMAADKVR